MDAKRARSSSPAIEFGEDEAADDNFRNGESYQSRAFKADQLRETWGQALKSNPKALMWCKIPYSAIMANSHTRDRFLCLVHDGNVGI